MTETIAFRNIDVGTGVVVFTAVASDLVAAALLKSGLLTDAAVAGAPVAAALFKSGALTDAAAASDVVAAALPNSGILTDAKNIADSALLMYQGVYPLEAPYFWWGRSILLPWSSQYWTELADKFTVKSIDPIELAQIVGELARVDPAPSEDILTFYSDCLLETFKSKVQGLAVETLLCADRCIGGVIHGDHIAAARWISATYKHLIEAMVEIHERGSVSENAKKAADVSHKWNRQRKAEVMEHYVKHRHEFKTNDAAAAALSKKFPFAFRTVQGWISEYLKSQRPASTP